MYSPMSIVGSGASSCKGASPRTIRAGSKHYNDQAALFVEEPWKPVLFETEALAAAGGAK